MDLPWWAHAAGALLVIAVLVVTLPLQALVVAWERLRRVFSRLR